MLLVCIRWIPWWKLLLEYRVRMELTYITTTLSVCIYLRYFLAFKVGCLGIQNQPTILWHIHEWCQNWIYCHFGFLHLLSGLLVHESFFCSEDKVAASNASSSWTTILWAIWFDLHLTLAIYILNCLNLVGTFILLTQIMPWLYSSLYQLLTCHDVILSV